jgi:hypothetical protein
MKLDLANPFVAEVFAFLRGECAIEEPARILEQALEKWGFGVALPPFPYDRQLPDDPEVGTPYVERYFRFLNETRLVLQTCRFSDEYAIIFDNTYCYLGTPRARAGIYTEWANQCHWLGKGDWTYIVFFTGDIADDYWPWAEAALLVVKKIGVQFPILK